MASTLQVPLHGTCMRILNAFSATAFGFSAVVQLNDPDPWAWCGLYGLATLVSCLGVARYRTPGVLAGALAVVALAWMAQISPGLGPVSWQELVGDAQMLRPEVEVAREFGGLALVALCMGLNAVLSRRP